MPEQGSERNDGQDRENEVQRVGVRLELLHHKHNGHEDQQPKQRIAADFLKEQAHMAQFSTATQGWEWDEGLMRRWLQPKATFRT